MAIERETIVTGGSRGGSVVAAIVGAVVVVLLVLWLVNGGLNFSRAPAGGAVDIDVPAVTVTPDGQ